MSQFLCSLAFLQQIANVEKKAKFWGGGKKLKTHIKCVGYQRHDCDSPASRDGQWSDKKREDMVTQRVKAARIRCRFPRKFRRV